MLQAFEIIRGLDKVDSATWFQRVDFHQDNQKCGRPFKLEAAGTEVRNKEKFLLKQSCGISLEHGPRSDKKIKSSEQF
jgi:hypothetical protein